MYAGLPDQLENQNLIPDNTQHANVGLFLKKMLRKSAKNLCSRLTRHIKHSGLPEPQNKLNAEASLTGNSLIM
jgi:hypothetical protein